MNKKLIIVVLIVLVLIVGFYQVFLKKEKLGFTLVEVKKGRVSEEISETGKVQKGEKISLNFKNAGRIEKIYVEVGKEVKRGEILAKLETTELQIKLQDANSSLIIAKANLDKLLAGAKEEEIKVSQSKVENSQIALNTAKQNLADSYQDAVNDLDDAYLKAYNAQNTVDSIQRTYFTKTDQEGAKVRENQQEIASAVSQIRSQIEVVRTNNLDENVDAALSRVGNELSKVSNSLKIIRETCEEPSYRSTVSSTDKTSLDTHRTNINTEIADINDAQQDIVSSKSAITLAEKDLQIKKDELTLLISPAQEEEVNLYKAKVEQAESQIQLLKNQIEESNLRSPLLGQVAEVKKKVGELVQPASQDVVFVILPSAPFQIKADIYEEDVVKINVANPVQISLVAFPDEVFQGKVVLINPAEKLIEGVVYYELTIDFEEMPEEGRMKSGMTADIIIQTALKENVLIVPKEAIVKKDGQLTVKVLKEGDKTEEREVKTGIEGADGMVEVISGIGEGEKIIVK